MNKNELNRLRMAAPQSVQFVGKLPTAVLVPTHGLNKVIRDVQWRINNVST